MHIPLCPEVSDLMTVCEYESRALTSLYSSFQIETTAFHAPSRGSKAGQTSAGVAQGEAVDHIPSAECQVGC